jgi:transcriptional regulator with XRE-family HTH domain
MDDLQGARGQQVSLIGFAPLLREYRDRHRLSQSRLAEAAGFDHSYVSRLESGTRMPTREAVSKLAEAMGLIDGERDALLASAGFMPGRIENLFASEPVLTEVLGLLQDRSVPDEVRDDVRRMISLLVKQAQRSSFAAPLGAGHRGTIAAA